MSTFSIIHIWATWAVWTEVLHELLKHKSVWTITLLWRREILDLPKHVSQHMIDIFDPSTYAWKTDTHNIAICTLWVWEPSKVSREQFVAIDKTAVINFAKACKISWVKHFLLLSSVWSDASSRSFFLRTKWELINELDALNFEQLSIFQPSMIITPTNRYWITQWLTLKIRPRIDRLFFGSWKKFRWIPVEKLGKSIALKSLESWKGMNIYSREDFSDCIV